MDLIDKKQVFKINLFDTSGDVEGIWAYYLTDKTKEIYNNTNGIDFKCILANHAVALFPNKSYGIVIDAVSKGKNRPESYIKNYIEKIQSFYSDYYNCFCGTQ